ncbi:hypothetical protein BJB45_06770 [Halomonas huangheensis]|uniref:Uncharacterized protein n=1 Tax=Halomonas huangheensis TaxID=1178482 RepID=W1N1K0_9GAMM|nr:hypothetical protein BJB45_06770 [Halomonas huangheensis]
MSMDMHSRSPKQMARDKAIMRVKRYSRCFIIFALRPYNERSSRQ